ncbi:tyrosine--tRNA ligase [Ructibacterium gallinarum]|uniref:Tyrosine--tRNA ligase n=1 Tax=Ructibacterium gallinarum TaxID=2779355 RepID=A0A9D5M3G4_9FIRM|nr:tyrosine--tRNA ligase [Ructibacterium gallinarum]MBE5038869.1 tyrosine--tRNA ligase [Ructibacterium gallinarum]
MQNVFDTLKERGLIAQTTHEEEIRKILGEEKITFYIGFDPTADSLHIGHFMQLIVMKHMQNAGHRPIILLGGGTTMVGDPTGKTDMRPMITQDVIQHNADNFKKQMSKFIDFSDGKALMVNNADWLLDLNYVDFLREVGVHFSVNRMLTAECFKTRLEKGLSFLEFNYMLMQGYDFYKLNRDYGCLMEFGGDDQWSNILGGIELIRRKEGKQAYGMTFTLLTTSEGKKMGKTEKGALWLDPEKVSPYEFYQYWRNVDDKDVIRMLKLVTFLPMEQIAEYEKLEGQELNKVKCILAYEVTKMVHGEEAAKAANDAALAIFSGGNTENMPSKPIAAATIQDGMNILDLLTAVELVPSKGEGRRLIQQNGLSINGEKATSIELNITADNFQNGELILKKGKKTFLKLILE